MIPRFGVYNGQQARLFCSHYSRPNGLLNTSNRRNFTSNSIRRQATQEPHDPVTGIPVKKCYFFFTKTQQISSIITQVYGKEEERINFVKFYIYIYSLVCVVQKKVKRSYKRSKW